MTEATSTASRADSPITATPIFRSTCGAPSPSRWATRTRCCRGRSSALPSPPAASTIATGTFPSWSRRSNAACMAAGALPLDFPDHLARRNLPEPHQHDVPQPDGDGRRGDDPRPADGCGGADRRLRQDRAGAADGRGLGGPAGDPARRRADAADGAITASGSAPAPIAGGSGRNTAPRKLPTSATSTTSRATSRPPPAAAR